MITSRIARLLPLTLGLFALLPLLRAAESPATPPPTAAQPATQPVQGHLLRKILIADAVETVEKLEASADGAFVTLAPTLPALDVAELNKRLAAGENRVIEEKLLAAIAQVIENFFRQFEYTGAQAIVPSQNIASGILRVIVLPGAKSLPVTAATQWKIRKIKMDSTRWFSESLLREKLRIEQGGMVQFSELDRAISWTNNNPFRRVKVKLDPVPNTGEADLTIAVQEAIPLRLMASYDNTGNAAIGENRYTAAISYGNLWGLDHQASYQFITTDKPRFFQGHGFDYRVPLSWRHYLQFSASYLKARPEFFDGVIIQNGETVTSDLRYTIPLQTGENSSEVYTALNFKESNNNLAYGGVQVLGTKTDIFQITTGASAVRRDKRGAWAFGASVTASPGGINSRNTDHAFDAGRYDPMLDSARFGAKARYIYGSVSFQRLLTLKPGWDLFSRGVLQASEANLLPSEQLSIGGASSVRGYRENVYSGDHGFVFSNELMTPGLKYAIPRISKTRGPLETRFLVFADAGDTQVRHKYRAVDPKRVFLAGAGVGVRMSVGTNFSLSADYGWQLQNLPYPVDEHARGHLKVSLAY